MPTRTVPTTRFGQLEVPEARLIHLSLGIAGFETAKAFVLVDHRPGSAFRWLQATDFPELAFVVVDPVALASDFPIDNVRRAIAFCELEPDEDIAVLAICTVPPLPEEPTANLLAPIGIGLRSRRGAQIILHDCGLSMRFPLSAT